MWRKSSIYGKAEKDITRRSCLITWVKQAFNHWYFKGFAANILQDICTIRQTKYSKNCDSQELRHEESNQQFPLLHWTPLECKWGPKHLFLVNRKWRKLFQSHMSGWWECSYTLLFTNLATTKSKTHWTIITLAIKTNSSYAIWQLPDPHKME